MDTNELMTKDEIVEVNEEIVMAEPRNGFSVVGIGLAVLSGIIAYNIADKYVIKPVIAKIKANKKRPDIVDGTCTEIDNSNNESDE